MPAARAEQEHTAGDRDVALGESVAALVPPDICLHVCYWLEIPPSGQQGGMQEDFMENQCSRNH